MPAKRRLSWPRRWRFGRHVALPLRCCLAAQNRPWSVDFAAHGIAPTDYHL